MKKMTMAKLAPVLALILLAVGGVCCWRCGVWSPVPEAAPNPVAEVSAPTAPMPPEPMPDFLAETLPPRERLAAVHALPDDLDAPTVRVLLAYLRTGPNGHFGYVLKNDLINRLRDQRAESPELTATLLKLAADRDEDIVVRVYALQHLRPWYERTKDPAIVDALYAALDEPENEVAGAALLALRYLSENYPDEFDRALVAARAQELAVSEETYILTRLSALQVAARLDTPDAASAAREILRSGGGHTVLRASAIAVLGDRGTADDLSLLEEQPDTGALRAALRAALMKLNKRN